MLGMEMMLKSLGLDPEEIKKQITGFGTMVIELKNQMDRIEGMLIEERAARLPVLEKPNLINGVDNHE